MGQCNGGVCTCPGGSIHGAVDMAQPLGASANGCSYSSSSATTGGLAVGLLGLALVLAVRRRRQ
jgi:MYXO-CTERM domain-containing protein